ncbi:MAG: glycosyltransferase family 2 protein [Egibacteraceae bacterium]
MTTGIRIGVVVTAYRRPQLLQQALRSLDTLTVAPVHVVVIDNSPDRNEEVTRLRFRCGAKLTYLWSGVNRGLPAAIGLGFETLDGSCDAVLVLDDDTILAPTTLASMAACLDDGVGAVAIPSPYAMRAQRYTDVPLLFPWSPTLLSADAIRQVGQPLHELFFGLDDWEYALRLRQRGYSIVWLEESLPRRKDGAGWVGRNYLAARNIAYLVVHKRLHERALLLELRKWLYRAIPRRPNDTVAWLLLRGFADGLRARMGPPPAGILPDYGKQA